MTFRATYFRTRGRRTLQRTVTIIADSLADAHAFAITGERRGETAFVEEC